MKRMLLIILISGILSNLQAPTYPVLYIPQAEGINAYEAIWNATCYIESSHDPMAIGDKNLKEWSYGIVQIRRTRLDDYFRQTGIRYSEKDMFCPVKSKKVFMFYCSQVDYRDVERISREWNGGLKGMQKSATKKYYDKIKKVL